MIIVYENEDKFLYAIIEAEVLVESINAIKLIYTQFLSNCANDETNCGSLIVSRRFMADTKKISHFEFCELVQNKLKELKLQYQKGEVVQCSGNLYPYTLIENV